MSNINGQKLQANYGLSDLMSQHITEAISNNNRAKIKRMLTQLHPADQAHFIALCSKEHRQIVIENIRNVFNAEVLIAMDIAVMADIIIMLGIERSAELLAQVDNDDAVYVIEKLPYDLQENILNSLSDALRNEVKERMQYGENTAGRVMSKHNMIAVMEYWTIEQTNNYLRNVQTVSDDFNAIFVVDHDYKPVGAVQASQLICNKPDISINKIMNQDVKAVNINIDQEEVSHIFKHYDLNAIPVVSANGRLVGSITAEDIVEIIDQEASEDILHMGGVSTSDIFAPIITTANQRLPWLLANLFIAIMVSTVISIFSSTIHSMVILASIMPIITSMGGNSGTQTLTVAVRSIATKELTSVNARRVILKEIIVSFVNGLLCAVLGALMIYVWQHDLQLSFVFALAIVINFTIGGLFGALCPILLDRLGIDPAVSSSIFLTTITDAVGFFVFLLLATFILL